MNSLSRLRLGPFILLLVIAISGPAAGQTNPQRNAATWYQRAYDRADRLTEAEWTLVREFDPASGEPASPELRAALEKAQPLLSLIERGSMQDQSIFDIDYSQGWETNFPPLHMARQMTQALRADAFVRLRDGETQVAAERIATAYRMSGHMGHDGFLISSLVGNSLFALIDEASQYAFDSASFGEAEAAVLLRAIDRLDPEDPFDFLGAVVSEQNMTMDWFDRLGEDLPEKLGELVYGDEPIPEAVLDSDAAQVAGYIEQYDGMMDHVVDIFTMDDPDAAIAAMNELTGQLIAGDFGPIAAVFTPAYSHVLRSRAAGVAALHARREALEKLIRHDADPVKFANAATWYLRGIKQLDELSERERRDLRSFDPTTDALDAEHVDLIAAALTSLHTFEEGANVERCDFSIAVSGSRAQVLPRYLAGMRDALRVLHVDARRQFIAEERDAAVERMMTSARIIAHLSADPQMFSAITSHAAFRELMGVITFAIENHALTEEERTRLLSAVDRIDQTDPFGYLAARRRVLAELPQRMQHLSKNAWASVRETETEAKRDHRLATLNENLALIGRADESTVLSIHAVDTALRMAIDGTLTRATSQIATYMPPEIDMDEHADSAEPMTLPRTVKLHALHDLLDTEQWHAVLRDAEQWHAALRRGELVELAELSLQPLNRIEHLRPGARRDLREALALLRPASDTAEPDKSDVTAQPREATDAPFAKPTISDEPVANDDNDDDDQGQ